MFSSFKRGIALFAAFTPAPSESYVSITFFVYLLISFTCRGVSAVPRLATAFSKPALCKAMTSIYPSHTKKKSLLVLFAKFNP